MLGDLPACPTLSKLAGTENIDPDAYQQEKLVLSAVYAELAFAVHVPRKLAAAKPGWLECALTWECSIYPWEPLTGSRVNGQRLQPAPLVGGAGHISRGRVEKQQGILGEDAHLSKIYDFSKGAKTVKSASESRKSDCFCRTKSRVAKRTARDAVHARSMERSPGWDRQRTAAGA
jgi:hypothetical protein